MSDTPGQIAYLTWWRVRYRMQQADPQGAYAMLPAADRRAWEAAAEAVLAQAGTMLTPFLDPDVRKETD